MRISKLLFILVTSLPFFADAQISISGIVKDLNDKSIKYANVVLTDSDGFIVVGTITDDDGKFELSYDEKCDCKLSITYLQFYN